MLSTMNLRGIHYAIVQDNKDEEKKLARVKVRFPWLPGGDAEQSHWAHVAVLAAGNKFGTFTLPEVGDMVAVMFQNGDINHPIVLGGVWSKVDTPPEVNEDGKNEHRFIMSRSGHRVTLDDSSKPKVVLTHKSNGNYAGVGEFEAAGGSPNKMKLEAPPPVSGSPTKGIAIASLEGKVNVWCPDGKLTIEAKDVEITAGDKMEIKAGGDAKVEASMSMTMFSTSQAKLEGNKVKLN